MTRLRRIADHDRIFFITVRLGRGITPLSPGERDIVREYVAAERAAYKFLLFGYAVMPDHLHLLMALSRGIINWNALSEDENGTPDSESTRRKRTFLAAALFRFYSASSWRFLGQASVHSRKSS